MTRIEINLEMDRWIIVKRRKKRHWCSNCAIHVEMMSVDDAALFARVPSRTIFRWAEAGALHSSETAEGLLLICPNSPSLNFEVLSPARQS